MTQPKSTKECVFESDGQKHSCIRGCDGVVENCKKCKRDICSNPKCPLGKGNPLKSTQEKIAHIVKTALITPTSELCPWLRKALTSLAEEEYLRGAEDKWEQVRLGVARWVEMMVKRGEIKIGEDNWVGEDEIEASILGYIRHNPKVAPSGSDEHDSDAPDSKTGNGYW